MGESSESFYIFTMKTQLFETRGVFLPPLPLKARTLVVSHDSFGVLILGVWLSIVVAVHHFFCCSNLLFGSRMLGWMLDFEPSIVLSTKPRAL